ncbi:MAG: DinB family protein [Gemmatimonadales bacterium]
MLRQLERRFARLERQRAALLRELHGMRPARLAFHPSPGKWSALDLVEHLVLAEEAVLRGIPDRPPTRSLADGARAAMVLPLLYLTFARGVRLRAPTRDVLPVGGSSLPQLEARWTRARANLRAVLQLMGPEDLSRPFFRHPVIGWLTTLEGLGFLERHAAHHLQQVKRVRASARRIALAS